MPRNSVVVPPPNIKSNFEDIIDFSAFKKKQFLYYNADLILTTDIKDMQSQEEDEGLSTYAERFSQGTANKSSHIWAHIFRMYGALNYIKKSNMAVLDLGCDTAFIRKMIHSGTYVSGTRYIGVDIKLESLKAASNKMPTCNTPAVFINQDLHNGLSFVKSRSIDVIYAGEVFEHLHEDSGVALLQDLRRILKKDGYIYLSMPNADVINTTLPKKYKAAGHLPFHHREYTIDEFKTLCSKNKLVVETYWGWACRAKLLSQVINPEHEIILNALKTSMGSQPAIQIIGQLYPEACAGTVYLLRRK